MSTVDVIISSMVFDYLKKIDTKLAHAFKKKTNALTLSKGSPEIHVIFNHFIKTNTLSKKIKLDAVDDDNIENNVQKKQKKDLNNSNKSEAEVKDVHQLNISAATDPIENTAIDVNLDYESEEDESSEDLQLPTQPKNDISGGEIEAVEDDDSEDESDNESNEDDGLDNKDSDSNDQLEDISFKPKTQEPSEDQEDESDWSSKRGRGGFRNRGGFHRGRGERRGGGGGGNRGNFRGGFRGGFRGRFNDNRGGFNDNRGGRGGGRGRGRFGGQEGSRGRGNFNNRHSNDFHGSPPQAKKFKFDS